MQEKRVIYGVTINGVVVYVGQTDNAWRRYREHATRMHHEDASPRALYQRLRAANGKNWDLVGLETCAANRANARESYWIRKLGTAKEGGCNKSDRACGGREKGCTNPTGADHYLYGKSVARHIVDASVAARKGKKLAPEHVEAIRLGNIEADRKDRKVVLREDGARFVGRGAAAASVGVSTSAITQAIKRNTRSGGFYWRYEEN